MLPRRLETDAHESDTARTQKTAATKNTRVHRRSFYTAARGPIKRMHAHFAWMSSGALHDGVSIPGASADCAEKGSARMRSLNGSQPRHARERAARLLLKPSNDT